MSGSAEMSQQQIVQKFKQMRALESQYISKISELQADLREHEMVLGVLGPLPEGRRCYRMAGEMLLEQTVKEVKPSVEEKQQSLQSIVGQLEATLKVKTTEREQFQKKHNIVVRPPGAQS